MKFVTPSNLTQGESRLMVNLQRFCERRWPFSTSVVDRPQQPAIWLTFVYDKAE